MKIPLLLLILCATCARAEKLIPSTLDPALAVEREKAFSPWCDAEQKAVYRKDLPIHSVQVYSEHKAGGLSRDIFLPSPDINYLLLDGLTEEDVLKTRDGKAASGYTLVSAAIYDSGKGTKLCWTLWIPRESAPLLIARMKKLGITPARIDPSPGGKTR